MMDDDDDDDMYDDVDGDGGGGGGGNSFIYNSDRVAVLDVFACVPLARRAVQRTAASRQTCLILLMS